MTVARARDMKGRKRIPRRKLLAKPEEKERDLKTKVEMAGQCG
jgi:hypothetical protein